MEPLQKRKQAYANSESLHQILNEEEISCGVVARNTEERPPETKCKECQVTRERDELIRKLFGLRESAGKHLAGLTHRQDEILGMVLGGHPSKNIAADLNISQRTVENHRASIMKKTGAKSLPELTRIVIAADWTKL